MKKATVVCAAAGPTKMTAQSRTWQHVTDRRRSLRLLVPLGVLTGSLLLGACSSPKPSAPAAVSTPVATATASSTSLATPRATGTPPPFTFPGFTPGAPGGAALAPPPGGLQQVALQVTDLPSGFALTASGPGGPDLGPNVVGSYQEEFQQRAITSTQSLQQTIVIVDLLGQYRDPASAIAGVKSVSAVTLNQILGAASLTAEAATIPPIGEDASAYHFSGTTNGVSVGGYLLIFHRGPMAAMVVTAAVKDAESLPQTIDLAQKQDQKLQATSTPG